MSKRGTSNLRSRPADPYVVEYSGQNFAGKGTMTDLSDDGMKILGTHTAHTGMRLALQLSAGESAIPIQIPCAYVRWTRNQEFGVKFGLIEPAVKAQLQDLLSTLQGAPTTWQAADGGLFQHPVRCVLTFTRNAIHSPATSICVTSPFI